MAGKIPPGGPFLALGRWRAKKWPRDALLPS